MWVRPMWGVVSRGALRFPAVHAVADGVFCVHRDGDYRDLHLETMVCSNDVEVAVMVVLVVVFLGS